MLSTASKRMPRIIVEGTLSWSSFDLVSTQGSDYGLFRIFGVAQSAPVGAGGLLVPESLSERGNLRLGFTNAKSSSHRHSQRRRRISWALKS
jgi:hypothetical protein